MFRVCFFQRTINSKLNKAYKNILKMKKIVTKEINRMIIGNQAINFLFVWNNMTKKEYLLKVFEGNFCSWFHIKISKLMS